MRRESTAEGRARRRLLSLLADGDAVALWLGRLGSPCNHEAVVRAQSHLLACLDAQPVADALDAAGRSLGPGDDGLLVGFLARGEARRAGVRVHFDADGLERWRTTHGS